MHLRGCLLSQLFATWFVVLIVLPFTAPFQVYDSGAPIAKSSPGHDLKTSDKLSHDLAVAASVSSTIVRTAQDAVLVVLERHCLQPLPILPTVLRL